MKPLALVLAGALVTAAPAALHAQAARPPAPRLQAQLRLGGMVVDNFTQAPDDAAGRDETAAVAEAQVRWRLSERGSTRLVFGADQVVYDEFGTARGILAGIQADGARHDLFVTGSLDWNRPAFDVGDTLGSADVRRADARYGYRVGGEWEPIAFAGWQHEDYDFAGGRDNDFSWIGAGLRYRGLGRRFVPEVGVSRGWRDAIDDEDDHGQKEIYFRVRSAVSDAVALGARYRYRDRDYSRATVAGAPREDHRHQVMLTGDWFPLQHAGLGLYYTWEDARSTRASRTFDQHHLSGGLILRR